MRKAGLELLLRAKGPPPEGRGARVESRVEVLEVVFEAEVVVVEGLENVREGVVEWWWWWWSW